MSNLPTPGPRLWSSKPGHMLHFADSSPDVLVWCAEDTAENRKAFAACRRLVPTDTPWVLGLRAGKVIRLLAGWCHVNTVFCHNRAGSLVLSVHRQEGVGHVPEGCWRVPKPDLGWHTWTCDLRCLTRPDASTIACAVAGLAEAFSRGHADNVAHIVKLGSLGWVSQEFAQEGQQAASGEHLA